MADRFGGKKRILSMDEMNQMKFSGELDMIQDPLSENIFKHSKTFPSSNVSNLAGTNMPMVATAKPKLEDDWIETGSNRSEKRRTTTKRKTSNTSNKAKANEKPTTGIPREDSTISASDEPKPSTNRTKSEPAPIRHLQAAPTTFRYSVAGYLEKTPSLAGELDMAKEQPTGTNRPFVSRVPVSEQYGALKGGRYPVNDYVPKRHKAKIVVWADLTVDAVDRLNESLNAEHIKQVLADIFVLDNYKDSLKIGIVMDLYFYTLQFAKNQGFSPEKTSAFFSIIKKVFEVCIETPFGNLDHTFEYFKDLIHCHSVNRPPYSIELFSPDEVRKITEYTINTFFRHFKMYKYAFTPLVRLDLSIQYEGMPPTPPASETDMLESETLGADDEQKDGEAKEEEIDEERQAAREELKNMVKNFLTGESKKIEGNVDTQVKAAVDALNNKIDQMTDAAPKAEGKGKKK